MRSARVVSRVMRMMFGRLPVTAKAHTENEQTHSKRQRSRMTSKFSLAEWDQRLTTAPETRKPAFRPALKGSRVG